MTSIKQHLDTLLKRCIGLHGFTYEAVEKDGQTTFEMVPKDKAVREFLTTLASETPDPTKQAKELADKMLAAWNDNGIMRELSAARIDQVGNFIASESHFKSMFFTTVTLRDEEQAVYVNNTREEIRCTDMSEDGTPEKVHVLSPQATTALGIYLVSSPYVRYKTKDLYRGDVSASARATFDIARDLRLTLDKKHYTLLNAAVASGGCYGAFSYEQARTNKATRIYVPHSAIDTDHLPTTNDIINGTTPGTSGTRWTVQYYDPPKDAFGTATDYTGFRPAVLYSIIDYANSWADLLPDAGDGGARLVPTGEILVPASDIINIALIMQPITNMTVNDAQKQLNENGFFSISAMGQSWRFIQDVTIPVGTCFPRFNLLPGITYEKPSWHKEFVKRDERENWEERSQQATYGAVIVSQRRVRGLRITYNAAD